MAALARIALCLALPAWSAGARAGRDVEYTLDTYDRVPDLDVVYTTNMRPALRVLNEWARERDTDFGLFIQTMPSQGLFYPRRISMVGISRGHRVLLFDLKPYLRPWPQPLPDFLEDFFEHDNHTFYGMGLRDTAARLAFEFDCLVRCVDYRIRAWSGMELGGGLYGVANRHLRMAIQRPETLRALSSQLVHTHLQWAVFDYFSRLQGAPDLPAWLITKAELFGAGPVYLRVAGAKHDWSAARLEWMHNLHQAGRPAGSRPWPEVRRGAAEDEGESSGEWEVEGDDVFSHKAGGGNVLQRALGGLRQDARKQAPAEEEGESSGEWEVEGDDVLSHKAGGGNVLQRAMGGMRQDARKQAPAEKEGESSGEWEVEGDDVFSHKAGGGNVLQRALGGLRQDERKQASAEEEGESSGEWEFEGDDVFSHKAGGGNVLQRALGGLRPDARKQAPAEEEGESSGEWEVEGDDVFSHKV